MTDLTQVSEEALEAGLQEAVNRHSILSFDDLAAIYLAMKAKDRSLEPTQRMAKILGCDFVPKEPLPQGDERAELLDLLELGGDYAADLFNEFRDKSSPNALRVAKNLERFNKAHAALVRSKLPIVAELDDEMLAELQKPGTVAAIPIGDDVREGVPVEWLSMQSANLAGELSKTKLSKGQCLAWPDAVILAHAAITTIGEGERHWREGMEYAATMIDKMAATIDCHDAIHRKGEPRQPDVAWAEDLAESIRDRAKQAPSRSDDSPPGRPDTVTPSSQDTSQ